MAIIKTLFSTKELAEYTGYSIHSIYYMIKNNTIPYYKPNRKVFFKKDDIDNWIDSEKVMNFLQKSGQISLAPMLRF